MKKMSWMMSVVAVTLLAPSAFAGRVGYYRACQDVNGSNEKCSDIQSTERVACSLTTNSNKRDGLSRATFKVGQKTYTARVNRTTSVYSKNSFFVYYGHINSKSSAEIKIPTRDGVSLSKPVAYNLFLDHVITKSGGSEVRKWKEINCNL